MALVRLALLGRRPQSAQPAVRRNYTSGQPHLDRPSSEPPSSAQVVSGEIVSAQPEAAPQSELKAGQVVAVRFFPKAVFSRSAPIVATSDPSNKPDGTVDPERYATKEKDRYCPSYSQNWD